MSEGIPKNFSSGVEKHIMTREERARVQFLYTKERIEEAREEDLLLLEAFIVDPIRYLREFVDDARYNQEEDVATSVLNEFEKKSNAVVEYGVSTCDALVDDILIEHNTQQKHKLLLQLLKQAGVTRDDVVALPASSREEFAVYASNDIPRAQFTKMVKEIYGS